MVCGLGPGREGQLCWGAHTPAQSHRATGPAPLRAPFTRRLSLTAFAETGGCTACRSSCSASVSGCCRVHGLPPPGLLPRPLPCLHEPPTQLHLS